MGLECNLLARMVTEYDNFFILFSHTITASLHENWLEPGLAWKVGMAQRGWRQSGHLLTFSISREECHLKVRASQMGLQKFQTSTEGQTMHILYAHNSGLAIF